MEQWKPVVGYEKRYEVSDAGRVRSLNPYCVRHPEGLLSIQTIFGYHRVLLFNGKTKMAYVHRLVWEAFRGPVPKRMVVNHIDHNKANARLENLEMITQCENLRASDRHHGGHPSYRAMLKRKCS